jgi:hypothetical protein
VSRRTTAEKRAAKRARLEVEAQAVATEREAWDLAYGDKPLTLEAAHWDDRGYMRWKAPTSERGSRLAFSRNFANPTSN